MGTRKVVVLHTEDSVVTDLGEMVQKLQEHLKRVAHGGHHNWAAVNEYLRNTPNPRNWKRLPELVLPMTMEVMREAIKRSTASNCSPGLDGVGKPLWHALAEYLAVPMTIKVQWQLSTGYIPEELDHGIRTHVPKKNRPPVVSNPRPLTMLNERAKIYSKAAVVAIEDMMQQLVPQQHVGFMKK